MEIITGSIPYPMSDSLADDTQKNKDIRNIQARQEQGTLRVYTRRRMTTEVQPLERQAEQPVLEIQEEEQPQLVDQQHSSTTSIDISDNGGE